MTIRQWFITVMIAFFSVIISGKSEINTFWYFLIPVAIAFLFWYLEIINQTFAKIEYNHIEELEKIIIYKDYKSFDPDKHLVVTSTKYPIFKEKIIIFFNTIKSSKYTVLGFYLLILGLVIFALSLIHICKLIRYLIALLTACISLF